MNEIFRGNGSNHGSNDDDMDGAVTSSIVCMERGCPVSTTLTLGMSIADSDAERAQIVFSLSCLIQYQASAISDGRESLDRELSQARIMQQLLKYDMLQRTVYAIGQPSQENAITLPRHKRNEWKNMRIYDTLKSLGI